MLWVHSLLSGEHQLAEHNAVDLLADQDARWMDENLLAGGNDLQRYGGVWQMEDGAGQRPLSPELVLSK